MHKTHRRPLALFLALLLLLTTAFGALSEEAIDAAAPESAATEEMPAEEPVSDEPVSEELASDEPVSDEPVSDEPVSDEPVSDEPAPDEPALDEPISDEPVSDAPVSDEPILDEPEIEQPAGDALEGAVFAGEALVFFAAELMTEEEGEGIDYETDVESDSGMFKVVACTLKIKGGKITAAVTLSGTGYDKLYVGAASDAAQADAADTIGYSVDSEGRYVFHVPVSKLDAPISIAAHAVRSDSWIDRVLQFKSESMKAALNDGGYTTQVESSSAMFKVINCALDIRGGKITATVTLSGTGYDMLYVGTAENAAVADAEKHIAYALDSEGRYTFTMPVAALDVPIAIAAHAVKSDSWIDRTLTFQSSGMQSALTDGDYTAEVESSSAMFKVVASSLRIERGKITVTIALSGEGYDKLFLGTAEDAAKDGALHIGYTLDGEGRYTFTFPVSALDTPIAIAAHSVSKDLWYDRTLTFKSDSLTSIGGDDAPGDGEEIDDGEPDEGEKEVDPPKKDGSTKAVDNATGLADGVYTPDKFTFSGGTGKVTITCSKVTVREGKAYATIVFSSGSYAYVKASGNKYSGSHGSSTSTFEIPVRLNANNTIIGMTTAMSQDHEITYTIYAYIAAADADADTAADGDAPAIIGMNYQSTDTLSHAQRFAIHRYEGGYIALHVTGLDAADDADYLLIPEGAEIPMGLDEGTIAIQLPIARAYVASEDALALLALIGVPEQAEHLAFVEGGDAAAPDYAALLKDGCDLAVLPLDVDEAARAEILERMAMLGIPAFIDRSAEEETAEGRLEWLKLYGLLFGCEELADQYLTDIP